MAFPPPSGLSSPDPLTRRTFVQRLVGGTGITAGGGLTQLTRIIGGAALAPFVAATRLGAVSPLTVEGDATLNEASPSTNYGTDATLDIGYDSVTAKSTDAYLIFNATDIQTELAGRTASNVTLVCMWTTPPNLPLTETIALQVCTSAETESTATWNNVSLGTGTAAQHATNPLVFGQVVWDVTTFINSGASKFRLKRNDTSLGDGTLTLHSLQAADSGNRPNLQFEYAAPTPSSSEAPTPTPTSSVAPTPSSSVAPTPTPTSSVTPTATATLSPTPTATITPTPLPSTSVTPTPPASPSMTPTPLPSPTPSMPLPSRSQTPLPTPMRTPSPTPVTSGGLPIKPRVSVRYNDDGDTFHIRLIIYPGTAAAANATSYLAELSNGDSVVYSNPAARNATPFFGLDKTVIYSLVVTAIKGALSTASDRHTIDYSRQPPSRVTTRLKTRRRLGTGLTDFVFQPSRRQTLTDERIASAVAALPLLDFGDVAPEVTNWEVVLEWDELVPGGPVDEYILEAGSTLGADNLRGSTGSSAQSVRVIAPEGTYYVRVRGKNAFGLGPPSNELLLQLGDDSCVVAPSAPTGLAAVVGQRSIALTWDAASGVSSYLMDVGSTPGGTEFGTSNVGSLPAFDATAPAGTYYIRVRGANSCGVGPASNEVVARITVTVQPPGAPYGLLTMVRGNAVDLTWEEPIGIDLPDDYIIEVGTAPGLANVGTTTTTSRSVTYTNAPRGTYFVRVRARNAGGIGPASEDVRLDVP